MVLKKLLKGRGLEAALLHADTGYTSNHARAQAFKQMGLGDERTYYRWIQRLNLGIPGEPLGDSPPNC